MEHVTVFIHTLDMPALKNYVRLHRHTVCAADSIFVWTIRTVHVKSYFRPFARSRAWSRTNSTLKSRAIKNEPVLSRASNCVIA